jgi:hypothetical protein
LYARPWPPEQLLAQWGKNNNARPTCRAAKRNRYAAPLPAGRPGRRRRAGGRLGCAPPRQRLRGAARWPLEGGAVALNGWVAIAPDGTVSVVVPRSEMGQGVHTALPMLLAEELDAPLSSVRISQAPIDKIFGNLAVLRENLPFHPDDRGSLKQGVQWVMGKVGRELGIMFTGGSTSVKDAWGRCAKPARWRARCWCGRPPSSGKREPWRACRTATAS